MSRYKFETTLAWHGSRGDERAASVTVYYERYIGFAGNFVEPGEPSSVEITAITRELGDGEAYEPIPADAMESEELRAECMEHWADDDAAALEYRDDQRREDRDHDFHAHG